MSEKYDIGLIGLAVMGANLARNLANNDHKTLVFNRTTKKTTEFVKEFGGENLQGAESLEEFVASLSAPRKIIIMIKAGNPVDMQIEALVPLLEKGDIVIDCGNSHWSDTVRREEHLKKKGILFFGTGVSGGEEGALNGPSIMPGGNKAAYQKYLAPIFESIAAKDFSEGKCVTWIGENGAGHYVKMVHNGIEYAVMQMLAEVYDMLRKLYSLKPPQMAEIFQNLHSGKLQSFLTEISIEILKKEDDLKKGYLIDTILDAAGQKGTGKWTVFDAVERGVAASSISEAVNARVISSQKDLRVQLSQQISPSYEVIPLGNPSLQKRGTSPFEKGGLRGILSQKDFISLLEDAISAGMLSAYAQGYALISQAAQEQNWDINLAEISRIWQGGCIIRARILEFLNDTFRKSGSKTSQLLSLPEIAQEISASLPSMRMAVSTGIMGGVPLPALSSALSYLENIRNQEGSANFIQALRDNFGAHTFERNDQEGIFHADWNDSDNS